MNKKKLSLFCTEGTRKSTSLRLVAKGLSTILKHRVLRTTKKSLRRKQFLYGQGVNKIVQYEWFAANDIPALEFTTKMADAEMWCSNGDTVFGRLYLNSSCGKGIKVFTSFEDVTLCPVYTLYKKKKREFRIHVFKEQVVAVVEKKRKVGWEDARDTKIRNLANGYVFVQGVLDEPEGLRELALRAAAVSPSDFRGVDIGYNELKNELFVIEVNSAPGIQGSNVDKYLQAIVNYV